MDIDDELEKEIVSEDPFILGLMMDSDPENNDNDMLSSNFVKYGKDPEKGEGGQRFVGIPLRRGDEVVFPELRIDISQEVLSD